MKILSFIGVWLLLSTSGFAQNPRVDLRPQIYADIVKSAQEIRSKKNEIRTYFMQIVLRKAQMDVVTILKQNHMSDQSIEQVLQSKEMKTFLSNLENHPQTQARVDAHVAKLMEPGAIEAHVLKRREQIEKKQDEQLLIAVNELQKSKTFRTEEKVHEVIDNRPLSSKAWDYLMNDLYKEQN